MFSLAYVELQLPRMHPHPVARMLFQSGDELKKLDVTAYVHGNLSPRNEQEDPGCV